MSPSNNNMADTANPLHAALVPLRAAWAARPARERQWLVALAAFLAAVLLWAVGVAPALKTLAGAPAQRQLLDAQLGAMQNQAQEAKALRAITPLAAAQATAALKATVERLGDKAKLSLQGERATISFTNIGAQSLRDCLNELRSAARARPVEATLSRSPQGYTGTLVLALNSGAAP